MDSIIVAALIGLGGTGLLVVSLWFMAERKHKNEVRVRETYWERAANRAREETQAALKRGDQATAEQLLATEFQVPMASISGSAFSNEVKVHAPDGELIAIYDVGKLQLRGKLTARLIKSGHDEAPPITITTPDDDKSPS